MYWATVAPMVSATSAAAPVMAPAIAPRTAAFSASTGFSNTEHRNPAANPSPTASIGLTRQQMVYSNPEISTRTKVTAPVIAVDLTIVPPKGDFRPLYRRSDCPTPDPFRPGEQSGMLANFLRR